MGNSKKKKARRAKKGSGPVGNGTDALRNTIAAPEDILALNDRTFASPNFTGDLFRQEVQVRARRERKPMHWAKRVKTRITAFKMRKQIQQELEIDAAAGSRFQNTQREIVDTPVSFEKLPRKQYTVTSKARYNRLLCHIDPDHFSYSPSGAMVKYINWTFKSGFSVVFLSFVVIFLLLVFLFGVIFKYVSLEIAFLLKYICSYFSHNLSIGRGSETSVYHCGWRQFWQPRCVHNTCRWFCIELDNVRIFRGLFL